MRFYIILSFMLNPLYLWSAYAQETETRQEVAYFSAGHFWYAEADFEARPGVKTVISGFMAGAKANATTQNNNDTSSIRRYVVQVAYDPAQISYQNLLSAFWRMHDPTDPDGSFTDRGIMYSSAIFYVTEAQKRAAQGAIAALSASKFAAPIVTAILPAGTFYAAEEHQQDYYKRNSIRYEYYRFRTGRDTYRAQIWDNDNIIYQITE